MWEIEMTHPKPLSKQMNRRSFLKLSGTMGIGLASASIWPHGAEAVAFNRRQKKVSSTRLAMGTFVSMILIHSSRDRAEEAMGLAFDEVKRLTDLMSRFDEKTAVAQLNKEGQLKGIPPEVAHVVAQALYFNKVSQGAFDITVKPVVDLFRDKFSKGGEFKLEEKEFREALELVGSNSIELDKRDIQFRKPGMGITLDGIAKGYIVDRASELLNRHGIKSYLINAGGDIRTTGQREDKKPWTVAIQDPFKGKNYPDIVHIRNGAIATSGNYEIYFDREKMFHHIVDPRTGVSPELSTSVSVIAPTAMEADALSTSVFVMNPVRGTSFINSLPQCESLVIGKDGAQTKSRGWKGSAI
ncbi:MAG: FAD:protein FMN transferase [Pseudomonadota bacterium]